MLDNFSERLVAQKPKNVFNQHKEKIRHLSKALLMSMQQSISKEESSYSNLRAKLIALSPINTLDRGYSIAYKEDRSIIRKPSDLNEGESFIVKLAKGDLPAKKISQN